MNYATTTLDFVGLTLSAWLVGIFLAFLLAFFAARSRL